MFYIVGVTATGKRLAVVGSLAGAEAYIRHRLPAASQGIYYIDGPLGGIVQLAEPTPADLPPNAELES